MQGNYQPFKRRTDVAGIRINGQSDRHVSHSLTTADNGIVSVELFDQTLLFSFQVRRAEGMDTGDR